MENRISNYKNYTIITDEGTERGIFFRCPIQKVDYNTWLDDGFSAWTYKEKVKNPLRKIYEILLGNKKVVDNIEEWSENLNWGGFSANILCLPIYFKREYRKLKAVSNNNTDNIAEINSYGYENEFNICSGNCEIEKTSIKLRCGKTIKIKREEKYNFTYQHIIEDIIDSGKISN